MALTLLP
jgi:hypothetical protein